MRSILLIVIFICSVYCEPTTETVGYLLETYANYVNSSYALDKNDRQVMKTWLREFQVLQVNVTSHYRLDMMRHKEHSFQWINVSSKWQECVSLHHNEIYKAEKNYYDDESKCLETANDSEGEERHSVYQVEKEIKKWRKSYRYLVNQCKVNHPGDADGAGECLVEYMKKDNYYITFQRLILLKLDCMSNLLGHMRTAMQNLENCLKSNLSRYLSAVRRIMATLNQCYSIKNKRS